MTTTAQTAAMTAGRRADTTRRRERVLKALRDTTGNGGEVTVSGIARHAGIDRTFLYRHRDLLEQVHAAESEPPSTSGAGPTVSRASLQADLLAAQERTNRLTARIRQLEKRLSHEIGENACKNQDSAPPPTSTNSKPRSPTSNNKPSTFACSSRNAPRTWPPPGQRTATS